MMKIKQLTLMVLITIFAGACCSYPPTNTDEKETQKTVSPHHYWENRHFGRFDR